MLFFIFKINSIEIFDKKSKQTKKIEISTNHQKGEKKKTNLIQITSNRKQWKDAIIIGICLIVIGQGLLAYGEQYLSSDITALLFSTVPIWIILFGKLYYYKAII